jgi:predicted DNA-binding antitoxin AbrB/MazE fold protein
MTRTIRARVSGGMLAPVEPLDLPEGSEVDVTVETGPSGAAGVEAIRATSGAWADLLDCEEFERALYERRHHHRAPVHL